MQLWPSSRANRVNEKLNRLLEVKNRVDYTFAISKDDTQIKYFSRELTTDLDALSPEPFRFVAHDSGERPDLIILTVHGQDVSGQIWELYDNYGEDIVVALWHWDNHHGFTNNFKSALAGDLIYPSHLNTAAYLWSPASVVGPVIPACVGQWSSAEAARLFDQYGLQSRKHSMLLNYVLYETYTERNEILQQIQDVAPEHCIERRMMPRTDISRYFTKRPDERFQEWAIYKATIILPLNQDVSTRLFDALLSGMVPIVAPFACEIDRIIPVEEQLEMGFVRLTSFDIDQVVSAINESLERFDGMGIDGVLGRHRYAIEHHLIINRVTAILENVYRLASGEFQVEFIDGPHGRALYQTIVQ